MKRLRIGLFPALLALALLSGTWGGGILANNIRAGSTATPPPRLNESVTVCVLDSGCNVDGALGRDFLSKDRDIADSLGHGTGVYTILSALAPKANIYMLRCFETGESIREEIIIEAIYAAVDEYHADIINMSWTLNVESPKLYEAVRYAYDKGVILLASAGNLSLTTGLGTTVYPAAWEQVIGVGGVDISEEGEVKGNIRYLKGEEVFVCARANYQEKRGSSYASPRVAALVATYLETSPHASLEEVQAMLKAEAKDYGELGYDTTYGWGYLGVGNDGNKR
jgi:subtilisin family serine protease